jgi:hypothetical protein
MAKTIRWMLLLAVVVGGWAFRAQLFSVARPGDRAVPLRLLERRAEIAPAVDVVLPVVPVGLERLRPGNHVLILHYWAPWERDAVHQILALDSLGVLEPDLRRAVVCFDPFPSVARFVARRRIRSPVLLDAHRELRRSLPCPSIPYTYVLDASGRIAVAQAGEIDWLSPETRALLVRLRSERAGATPGKSTQTSSPGTL